MGANLTLKIAETMADLPAEDVIVLLALAAEADDETGEIPLGFERGEKFAARIGDDLAPDSGDQLLSLMDRGLLTGGVSEETMQPTWRFVMADL